MLIHAIVKILPNVHRLMEPVIVRLVLLGHHVISNVIQAGMEPGVNKNVVVLTRQIVQRRRDNVYAR